MARSRKPAPLSLFTLSPAVGLTLAFPDRSQMITTHIKDNINAELWQETVMVTPQAKQVLLHYGTMVLRTDQTSKIMNLEMCGGTKN